MPEATVGFALSVGAIPATWLPIRSFEGTEGISRQHEFKIEIETPIPALALETAALGSTATLTMRSAGHDRHVHGMIVSIQRDDTALGASPDHAVFTLVLAPRAWLLTRRRGSRIFQDMSVVDVINAVLQENELPRVWALARPRPKRAYITQYQESDWDFVCRLAAENGIFFHFEHPELPLDPVVLPMLASSYGSDAVASGAEIVAAVATFAFDALGIHHDAREIITFSDQAAYVPIEGLTIPYLASGAQAPGHDYVSRLTSRRAIRPTAATFIEYDWRRPTTKITSRAEAQQAGPSPLPTGNMARPGEPAGLEVYEHSARDHEPDWDDAAEEAARILAIARRNGIRLRGESSSVRIVAGRQLLVEAHLLEEGPCAITRVRHSGSRRQDGASRVAYGNRFHAVPASIPYLAPVPERTAVHSHLTAIVAGAENQEIHVNESGQIKVEFPWDRRGEHANPTCWLRCMHPWAGNGWGFQFIPRVGMEVVVGFEAGDPDRPLVLGTVYNVIKPEPFTLPQHKTRSGIRTQSTPKGDGFNELSFEDKIDEEQVFLRAQRDLDFTVLRDRSADIQRDDSETIGGGQQIQVELDRRLEIKRDHEILVRRNARDTTEGEHVVRRHSLNTRILEDRMDYIDGLHESHIRGPRASHTHMWQVDRVDGNSTHLVGHGANDEAGGNWAVDVRGRGQIHARGKIDISSAEEIMLRVGSSHIRIGGDGIEIVSGTVTVKGSGARIRLGDDKCDIYASDKVQVVGDSGVALSTGQGASVGLQSQVKVSGSQILLNSPEQASDSLTTDEPTRTTVTLKDDEGNVLPHQHYRVVFEDGTIQTGATDEDGQTVIEGEGAGEIEFPDHHDPEEE